MNRTTIAVFVAFAAAPAPAWGHACDRTDDDASQASRVIRTVSTRIDVLERSIAEALRRQTAQLSGYMAQGTKAVVGAIDAQTRLQAQTVREAEETRSVVRHKVGPTACATATGAAGLAAARAVARKAAREGTAAEAGRISADRKSAPAPGANADTSLRFATFSSTHCNAARQGGDAAACKGSPARHGADLQPANLFELSTIRTPDEELTARELARNLTVPIVHDPLPVGSAETDQERRRVLLGRSADSRTALAADFFAYARALRAPAVDLGGWAKALSPGGSAAPGTPVSRYELLETLAAARHGNASWFAKLQTMSDTNLLRELVTLQAISLTLDWERFRLNERRGAMEATRLALATERMRTLPGLAAPAGGVN